MSTLRAATTISEQYDRALRYARHDHLRMDAPRPRPTSDWPAGNIEFLTRYRDWLLSGGVSKMVTDCYHVVMAGHVLGLTLKQYPDLDPDADLECALAYIRAKHLGPGWTHNCQLSLLIFRRFLRLEKGLGEEQKPKSFDVAAHTRGLPGWVVSELERYQRSQQRNWRERRMLESLRLFWGNFIRIWRFLCEQRGVGKFEDLKRQHILDYVASRLDAGYAVSGVNTDLHLLLGFLVFLQAEGYPVLQSLLRIPGLKLPDSLPKQLTDEQVRKVSAEIDRAVREAKLTNHRRLALLDRAAFYLLWQAGMRIGEVEDLRLEDLDLGQKRLSIRDGKGRVDRTVYLTTTGVAALQEFLAVRGEGRSPHPGTGDHVFLFRHLPISRNLIRSRLRTIGKRIGVKVQPHRLRHTMASQLLNAGCRITSIQRLLGHKRLNTTLIYARAHDQTVADDYFAAMERVEQRLDLSSESKPNIEVVKVQPAPAANSEKSQNLFQLIGQLEVPELCLAERLGIASQLRQVFEWQQQLPLRAEAQIPAASAQPP